MSNRNPVESLLDIVVYGPLGAALTLREEFPNLAEKGRAKVSERLGVARIVGQFAVVQGRREAERRFKPRPTDGRGQTAPPDAAGETGPDGASNPVAQSLPTSPGPGIEADVRLLAIPGYDSLSAPQVVQRLAGLSAEEREAVRTYEASHRARQTILARVAQLHDQ